MQGTKARKWLILAWAGYTLVLLAIAIVCLVIFAKEQFSWLVGPAFLGSVVGMVLAGSIVLIVAEALLPGKTWRTVVVIVWSLVALTSPLFGIMFLLPWGLLLVTAPAVFVILLNRSRVPPATVTA